MSCNFSGSIALLLMPLMPTIEFKALISSCCCKAFLRGHIGLHLPNAGHVATASTEDSHVIRVAERIPNIRFIQVDASGLVLETQLGDSVSCITRVRPCYVKRQVLCQASAGFICVPQRIRTCHELVVSPGSSVLLITLRFGICCTITLCLRAFARSVTRVVVHCSPPCIVCFIARCPSCEDSASSDPCTDLKCSRSFLRMLSSQTPTRGTIDMPSPSWS